MAPILQCEEIATGLRTRGYYNKNYTAIYTCNIYMYEISMFSLIEYYPERRHGTYPRDRFVGIDESHAS